MALETSSVRTCTKNRSLRFGESRLLYRGDAMGVWWQHPPGLMGTGAALGGGGQSKSGWDWSGEAFRGLGLLVGLLEGQVESQRKLVMANGRVFRNTAVKQSSGWKSDTAGFIGARVVAPVAHQICTIKIGERISELRVAWLSRGG